MEIKGKYASAKVFANALDDTCQGQIEQLCSQEIFAESKIRIMPDCHKGKGCVIGFTANLKDKIIPNLVGVDISCSISAYKLDVDKVDLPRLDDFVRKNIPYGDSVRKDVSKWVSEELKDSVREVSEALSPDGKYVFRDLCSIGSLGGGNHFLELNRDSGGALWFSIHCGSRNFGHRICNFHQKKSIPIEGIPKELQYIEGDELAEYLKHMRVAQDFAKANHEVILHEVCEAMGWNVSDRIFTNHNYVEILDRGEMLIRKGAISAKEGERVIIPMNMRDGSLIGLGKGNSDWNYSAPHGAGRVLSRAVAFETLSVEEFKKQMENIYSTCVTIRTLDESPMAYKNMDDILEMLVDTVEVRDRLVPIYNFKAS